MIELSKTKVIQKLKAIHNTINTRVNNTIVVKDQGNTKVESNSQQQHICNHRHKSCQRPR